MKYLIPAAAVAYAAYYWHSKHPVSVHGEYGYAGLDGPMIDPYYLSIYGPPGVMWAFGRGHARRRTTSGPSGIHPPPRPSASASQGHHHHHHKKDQQQPPPDASGGGGSPSGGGGGDSSGGSSGSESYDETTTDTGDGNDPTINSTTISGIYGIYPFYGNNVNPMESQYGYGCGFGCGGSRWY
jgi:hypothetical protein